MSAEFTLDLQRLMQSHGERLPRYGADGQWGTESQEAFDRLMKPGGRRRTNDAGVALIKSFEGLRLKAYPDPATGGEPITVGYGHTGGVKLGQTITEAQADAFLRADLERFERAVDDMAPVATDNQFAAMVSLAFNVGEANLRGSTLLKKHRLGDYAGAQQEFAKWRMAAGKVMAGLVRRRAAEAALYGSAS